MKQESRIYCELLVHWPIACMSWRSHWIVSEALPYNGMLNPETVGWLLSLLSPIVRQSPEEAFGFEFITVPLQPFIPPILINPILREQNLKSGSGSAKVESWAWIIIRPPPSKSMLREKSKLTTTCWLISWLAFLNHQHQHHPDDQKEHMWTAACDEEIIACWWRWFTRCYLAAIHVLSSLSLLLLLLLYSQ